MKKIDRILIFTMKKDLRLTRICVASIRFWYPDIRIDLVKDEITAPFDTTEIESSWNVGVERCGKAKLGGCGFLIKFEPLLISKKSRILILDSDIVLAGRVIERLERHDEDFVVAEDYCHGSLTTNYAKEVMRRSIYDFDQLKNIDPDFELPEKFFNAGQMVISTGEYSRGDLDPFVDWCAQAKLRQPQVFQMGDQGIMNYILERDRRSGRISMAYDNFAIFSIDHRCEDLNIESIAGGDGYPCVIHWTGHHHLPLLRQMAAWKIVAFYEQFYYSKVQISALSRSYRSFNYSARRLAALIRGRWRRCPGSA
jgi:lipopolysaccharide biosynthesis glycosyltransferase